MTPFLQKYHMSTIPLVDRGVMYTNLHFFKRMYFLILNIRDNNWQ